MFTITNHPTMRRAHSVNAAVRYCASECIGCFDRSRMSAELRALGEGESATFAALRFVGGPADPAPIIITRDSSAYR